MTEFKHYSVLLHETVDILDIDPDGLYVDCTLGGGGHSLEIVKRLKGGRLIAIDRDRQAIAAASQRLLQYRDKIEFVNDNFCNIKNILNGRLADGIIADLGVSSYQLDTPERGFSYHNDAPLDMRMDTSSPFSAKELVNEYGEAELIRILRDWGEERYAARIASKIAAYRKEKSIETTLELADIIKSAVPASYLHDDKHPARRSFQAIRIEVNGELEYLGRAVKNITDSLARGGVAAFITFHSLEDRIVKEEFKKMTQGCTCPKNFPVCVCGFEKTVEILTKKPILPGKTELNENSRSRSAKLRAARKI